MPQNIAQFEWPVDPRGYRWREGARLQHLPHPPGAFEWDSMLAWGTVLALEDLPEERDLHSSWYVPDAGLFRTFADLDGSPEQILLFANRYGQLGLRDPTYHPADPWHAYKQAVDEAQSTVARSDALDDVTFPELPDPPPAEHESETITGWRIELAAMRMCIDLYDTLRSAGAEHALRWHFSAFGREVADGEQVFMFDSVYPDSTQPLASWWTEIRLIDSGGAAANPDDPGFHYAYQLRPYHTGEALALYEIRGLEVHQPRDTVVDFARVMLAAVIDAHLSGRIETMLLQNPRTNGLVLYTMPNSLIGALWLQLAESIDGHKEFRQCESCRNWFELAPDKARADKLYCSQACRSRAYRRRSRETAKPTPD